MALRERRCRPALLIPEFSLLHAHRQHDGSNLSRAWPDDIIWPQISEENGNGSMS